jgi:5-methylcytosine-specific restriction endonuclease McrA
MRKYNMITKAGGQCTICGYKKNLSALAFHHVDEKTTNLTGTALIKMSIKGAEEELNKCVLVCHNCHSEIHHPQLELKIITHMWKLINKDKLTYTQAYIKCLDS